MNILLVGCGKIGSRHIQSIAGSKRSINLFCLDTSNESLINSQKIYDAVEPKNKNSKLIITQEITEIRENIEIVIVASNSSERAEIIDAVLSNFKPKHLLLEKVLFNKISDYEKYDKIFKNTEMKVWVNQYMGYEFEFLREHINLNERFTMTVYGNWGLCCNSVHFIEIFHYLCRRTPLSMKQFDFTDIYEKSKRDGYYELFGEIVINSINSQKLILNCNPEEPKNIINIDIDTKSNKLCDVWVDEHHNCVTTNINGEVFNARYYNRRQSERTLELIESLIKYDKCNLPTYDYSAYHHLLILKTLEKKFIDLGIDISRGVPIT